MKKAAQLLQIHKVTLSKIVISDNYKFEFYYALAGVIFKPNDFYGAVMSQPTSTHSALFLVFGATIALAFKGIVAKMAYASGMTVDAVLLVRFALAVPLFWLGVRWMTGGWTGGMTFRDWRDCAGMGALFFAATYGDFKGLSYIDVGLSRLILFTFPALVMLLSAAMDRRAPSLRQMIAFSITYGGLILVLAPRGMAALSVDQLTGIGWSFLSASTYAVYLTLSQKIMARIGSPRFTAASGSFTFVYMVLMAGLLGGDVPLGVTLEGFGWGVVIAVACTVIPFFMLFEGIARSDAARASMISLSGIVITVTGAYFLLGETFTPLQIAGCALVLLGVLSVEGEVLRRKRAAY